MLFPIAHCVLNVAEQASPPLGFALLPSLGE